MPHVSAIYLYPIKSTYRVPVDEAWVEPWGLAGDRRWVVVDAEGVFVTQRRQQRLATVRAAREPDGGLVLRAPGMTPLHVPLPPAAEHFRVRIWEDVLAALPAGGQADAWLRELFGTDLRLAYLDDPTRRKVDEWYGRPQDRVTFADRFPLLVTTEASLEALNASMDEPLPMSRFRPNVVIGGTRAWEEDEWAHVRLGQLDFRAAKRCARCVVTTTDQETGGRGTGSDDRLEPLRALARTHRLDGKPIFGDNLIPDGRGTITVGDAVAAS